ncbi:MAG: hydrogenase expression/formation protein HypE [Planctomycetales bacterium]
MNDPVSMACPLPDVGDGARIQLAHGEGGRLMRELLARHILPPLSNDDPADAADAAVLPALDGPPVFTTDGYVVSPLFFPGGDIGSLAVYGTCNDLAVAGARPRWMSLGFIIEEEFSLAALDCIVASVAQAARRAGVQVVTGDTKVVPKGAADGLFVSTSGIGERVFELPGPATLQPGDALLVSGPIGRHGIAVLAAREKLEFDPPPESDSGPLFPAVAALRDAGVPVKALRDATRGGTCAVLHEWSAACGASILVEWESPLVTPEVRGVCELLGLDPLHIACEGTMVIAIPRKDADAALDALRTVPISANATRIGTVIESRTAPVLIRRTSDRLVPLDEPLGAPLPRIC